MAPLFVHNANFNILDPKNAILPLNSAFFKFNILVKCFLSDF